MIIRELSLFLSKSSGMKKAVLFGLLITLVGCGDPAEQGKITVKQERIPIEITEGDIFKGNLIAAFLENDESFVQEANAFFLKGINAFRNENDLDSADYYFRKSILKEPSAKAYFELGNVNLDKKDFETALLAYDLAEQLDYEPFSKVLYNKTCLYSLKGDDKMAAQYLEYALQAGYNNLEHINKDEDLDHLRESYLYKPAVEKGLRGMSDAENLFWLQFKRKFAVMDMPIKLKAEVTPEFTESLEYISYDYEKYIAEMRDEQFSREVSKGFYYFARPYETENFVALIYIVKDEFMGEYAPLTYRMATFTHEGKLIDKKIIGGAELLGEPVMVSTIKKDLTIDVDIVELEYEKDPDSYGYYENPMISSKVIGKSGFVVTANGKIQMAEVELFAESK